MSELKSIFMNRDGMTSEEADARIEEMRDKVMDGADPEEILNDEGLEPDYILDIL
jgi:hypothetical protein